MQFLAKIVNFGTSGLRSNWDFGWELAIQLGMIFFRWDFKTPCIKHSEYKSQAKKKKDLDCNFVHPNKFLVVSIFILIFHGLYSPIPTNIFLQGANFLCVVARGWEDFKFLGELMYWRYLISFLGEGGQTIFFHKAINDQSCKLKNG